MEISIDNMVTSRNKRTVKDRERRDIILDDSFNVNEFRGKRILVTGGTKGIGEAIVKRLKSAGGTIITTA